MNIALDDIRSKAPEGATHHVGGNRFYHYDDFWEKWFSWKRSKKTWVIVKKPSGLKPL